MKSLFVFFLMFVITSPSLYARLLEYGADPIFNVVDYGAIGNGETDDSNAFVKAWEKVCGAATQDSPTLVIPEGKTFLLQPVLFKGPCKPTTINIKLQGTIIAPESVNSWKWSNGDKESWVEFSDINGLVINGGGKVDGQGAAWWGHAGQDDRPTALRFSNCKDLTLSTLKHVNSPRNHISINGCNSASISNLHINAPGNSPNTDGFDISGSSRILIQNSVIATGDDCVAINSGSSFINITGVLCGPGHGISVGSLGRDGDYAQVNEVHVKNCTFRGTTNGARIKTWAGGRGYARNITFEDITLIGVKNPVIINQQYIDKHHKNENADGGKAVKVSDVTYRNVIGTSVSKNAITLNCDRTTGCTNIVLDNVHITNADGDQTYASCKNAQGICSSCYPRVPCLSHK